LFFRFLCPLFSVILLGCAASVKNTQYFYLLFLDDISFLHEYGIFRMPYGNMELFGIFVNIILCE